MYGPSLGYYLHILFIYFDLSHGDKENELSKPGIAPMHGLIVTAEQGLEQSQLEEQAQYNLLVVWAQVQGVSPVRTAWAINWFKQKVTYEKAGYMDVSQEMVTN